MSLRKRQEVQKVPRGLNPARSLLDAALILISSVLLVLPFHFGVLWPLAFFAFVPFFFTIGRRTSRQALAASYAFGLAFFGLLGFWLSPVNVIGFALLLAYLALYFALFGFFSARFLNPGWRLERVFFVASIWVMLEVLRGWVLSGLPWALLGYSQWKNLPFIQAAEFIGPYGISFLVMAVNVCLFKLLQGWRAMGRGEAPRGFWKPFAATLAVIAALTTLYGRSALAARDVYYASPGPKAQIRIGVVQGNIPQDEKWNRRVRNIIFEKYRRLTLMAALERADLIIWPETSFPGYLEDEVELAAELRQTVREARTNVLVGAPAVGELEEGLKLHNSAILYAPDGQERRRYHKMQLVPFGEYVPFEAVFGFIRQFVAIGHFSPGATPVIFETQSRFQERNIKVRFGVLICYEDIFPGLVRRFCAPDGADFLVNITNDAWFGRTSAPYQHAQASVFRAVENRIPVVRAANTGLSCFISPEGRILSSVSDNRGEEIFVTGHRTQDIVLRKGRSFYSAFGDVFLALPLLLCLMAYRMKDL